MDVEGGGGDVAPQASVSTSHSLSRCAWPVASSVPAGADKLWSMFSS